MYSIQKLPLFILSECQAGPILPRLHHYFPDHKCTENLQMILRPKLVTTVTDPNPCKKSPLRDFLHCLAPPHSSSIQNFGSILYYSNAALLLPYFFPIVSCTNHPMSYYLSPRIANLPIQGHLILSKRNCNCFRLLQYLSHVHVSYRINAGK
jgi:hypothetical protein